MKKIYLFLIVFTFLSNLTSCNNKTIKESNKATQLNLMIELLDINGQQDTTNYTFSSISNVHLNVEELEPYKLSSIVNKNDYYTCAYLDDKAIEILNEKYYYFIYPSGNKNLKSFEGKEALLLKYSKALDENLFDKNEYGLSWYEFSNNKDIPEKIENKTLVLVSESYNINVGDKNIELFVEKQEIERDIYNQLFNYGLNEYLTFDVLKSLDENIMLSSFYLDLIEICSFEIQYIENEAYVNLRQFTLWGDNDLKDTFPYSIIKNNGKDEYLFKYKDLVNLFL